MKTILILGGTGMLGNSVGKLFQGMADCDVWLTTRKKDLIYGRKDRWLEFDPTGKTMLAAISLPELLQEMPHPDYIINCVGIIKPFVEQSRHDSILINSLLPHTWATYCKSIGSKFLHITTDCVFSGAKGNYTENDAHDCLDIYGKSKSIGEPKDAMVLRTSIIGPEIHKGASLIAWAQSQKGNRVKGFSDHFWNGLTTLQYGKVCQQIIEKDLYQEGLFHIFSNKVSKRELLEIINKAFNLGLQVEATNAPESCDRSLSTAKPAALMTKLDIPWLDQQLAEIAK